jgi:hypothetical protein
MRWGSAVAGVVLIAVGVALFGGWTPAWAGHKQTDRVDAAVVRLDTGSGSVAVRRGDVERIALVAQSWSWRDPGTTWRRDGDTLELDGCGWGCSVSYDLVVPPNTRIEGEGNSGSVRIRGASSVDVEVSSGSIDVQDVAGAVRASTSSGSVRLERIAGPATVHTSSGRITGSELAGPVDAKASSGDVNIGLARAQDVRAETSSGDVEVAAPAGRYRISVDGDDAGGEYPGSPAGLVADSSARYALDLHTSSGDALLRAR